MSCDDWRTLLQSFPAGFAVQARVSKPLDTDTITKLHGGILGVLANSNNNTDTLVL